jgi:DNA-binding LacI/PurR family transcriptional regulator
VKSLADVARLAGVSKATASRALNSTGYVAEITRQKVAAAASELGYVASTTAASLVTGRTRNVAVVTPYINRWFFAEVIDGIEEALLAAGYDLTLYRLRGSAEQRSRVFDYFLVRKRVDAVIAVGMELEQHDLLPLTSLRKPLVAARALGLEVPRDLSVVGIDDHPLAELFELTTVRQVPSEQGSMAVGLILDLLAGSDPVETGDWDVPVELVVRGSTTSPPLSEVAAP